MRVPYVDLPGQYALQREEILAAVDGLLASGRYILGDEVERFERTFAALCGTRFAIGVGNGTDALVLALRVLGIGPGDEVITAANSWVSSASSIALLGATPVFADVGEDMNLDPAAVAAAITPRTRAIMPVHLTGRCAPMEPLAELATSRGLHLLEDAAQAVGARYGHRPAGSLAELACFSLHPLKNLNAAGDAGVITTDNAALAEQLGLLRNHGLKGRNEVVCWGYNSRLDALQAAMLNLKMAGLEETIEKRRAHAARYRSGLDGVVRCPREDAPGERQGYHLFVIRCEARDRLKQWLREHDISSAIHYPTPIHLQPVYQKLRRVCLPETEKQAGQILSLPVHHMLDPEQIDFVIERIRAFYGPSGR